MTGHEAEKALQMLRCLESFFAERRLYECAQDACQLWLQINADLHRGMFDD